MSGAAGFAATLGRLRAVAALTFLEAVRRKVFLIVLIVGAAIVSSAAFLPSVDPAGRLRLVEIWSVRTVTIFCSLGAVFLAGFSLPGDFEQRRVYTLVTKPIHKGTLFLGKFLGFLLLMAVFLVLMGFITLGYLRLLAAVSSEFPEARVYPRHDAVRIEGSRAEVGGPRRGTRTGDSQPLEWTFENLPAGRFAGRIPARGKIDLRRLPDMEFRLEADVRVTAVNPATREEWSQVVRFQTNRMTEFGEFDLPLRAVTDDGRLIVRLAPEEDALQIAAMTEDFSIRSEAVNFQVNFMKGLLLVLLQSSMVLLATLAASTFVSAPVSILLGICLFLAGSTWSFVTESLEDVDRRLKEVEEREHGDGHAHGTEEIPPWILRVSGTLSRVVLEAVPNFDAFNFADWLLTDTAISARDLGRALLSFAPRAAVLLLAGLLLISFRDFAT
jgi:hypothetical protein